MRAVLLAFLLVRFVGAQQQSSPEPAAPTAEVRENLDDVEAIRERAERVEALLRGELDPAVDARALMRLNLGAGAPAWEVGAANELARTPRDSKRRPAAKQAVSPGEAETRRLADAYRRFVKLPPAERERLLLTHEARRRAARDAADAKAEQDRLRLELETKAERLGAFLAGTLVPDVDPRSLVVFDFGDPTELFADEGRTSRVAASATPSDDETAQDPLDPFVSAQLEFDRLRLEYLSLSDAQRRALFETHDLAVAQMREAADTSAREAEAQQESQARLDEHETRAREAAKARERALVAAEEARTEAARLIEEERARLLGVREARAHYEAELERQVQLAAERHERALELKRRATDLVTEEEQGIAVESRADALYEEIVAALVDARGRMSAQMATVLTPSDIPPTGEPLDAGVSGEIDRTRATEVLEEIERHEDKLIEVERETRTRGLASTRDDTMVLNRARLDLIDVVSESKRNELLGFGPQGVRQAGREVLQISLQARYHLFTLPNRIREAQKSASESSIPLILGTIKIVFVFVFLRWWRSRADGTLTLLRRRLLENQRGSTARLVASLAWYAMKVRSPLEILLGIWLSIRIADQIVVLPELRFVWLVSSWVLVGMFVVRLLDAIAARQQLRRGAEDTEAALRMRSLRMVGLAAVLVGLLLAITEESVGRGAIFEWARVAFWVGLTPIGFVLIRWWRPAIEERIDAMSARDSFSAWASKRRQGLQGFLVAGLSGAYLLARGTGQLLVRQLSHLDITRRALAYVFRREVARRAEARTGRGDLQPAFDELADRMGPHAVADPLVQKAGEAGVEAVYGLVSGHQNTTTVVVGERGAGKSVFMDRLRDRCAAERTLRFRCPPGGLEPLLASMREAVVEGEGDLVGRLRETAPSLVLIDDAHRLVRPRIGGLRDLDRLVELARSVGRETSWVLSMNTPIWHHVSRARGERAMFDQIVALERFREHEIAELIRTRTQAAELEPSFEELIVPSRLGQGIEVDESNQAEHNYYRILWDYSEGNPAVALHFWRRSLFRDSAGTLVVRLFEAPTPGQLEDLPNTTYFVLRSIVQLEPARESDIVECTMLQAAEVADALRFARARGWLEWEDGRVSISWRWYRAIVGALRRQHLLKS